MIENPGLPIAARADLFVFLADLLRPPSPDGPGAMAVEEEELDALLETAGLASEPALRVSLHEAAAAGRALGADDWSDEYHRLFEGSLACPPNESAYVRRDKGAILGDLCGFYRAFGWKADESGGERPDHLVTELEFVAVLMAMLATADTEERREVTGEALEEFVVGHLGEWLPAFCHHLAATTWLAYYEAAAAALARFWAALVSTSGWAVTEPDARPEPRQEPEEPLDCPAASILQQVMEAQEAKSES